MPTAPVDARAVGDRVGPAGQADKVTQHFCEKSGGGGPAAPRSEPGGPHPARVPGRSTPSRQGAPGRVSEPGARLPPGEPEAPPRLRRGPKSRQPAPWGSLGAPPARSSGAAERALSAPCSPAPAAAGCAPRTPGSPRARGASSLPTCPRLGGAGHSPPPVRPHTPRDYSPHPRLPHSPPPSSRHAAEHSRAHSAHYRSRAGAQPAGPRNFQRPPRNFSQLRRRRPPPPPRLPPSLPPTPNPRQTQDQKCSLLYSPPPRSPSHTRD